MLCCSFSADLKLSLSLHTGSLQAKTATRVVR